MIPNSGEFLRQDFELENQPSRTFRINSEKQNIRGYIDEMEAVKQAVYKILSTERYQYIMYSGDYGIELLDLFGEPASYVCPELERRISEALTWDDRIESVSDFKFDLRQKGAVVVSFVVHTIFGEFSAQREVNF